MNKRRVIAAALRKHLERRLASQLDCAVEDLRSLKLGTLVHLLFVICGDLESIGGFHTTIHGFIALVGDVLWEPVEVEETEAEGTTKEVIN